MYASFEALAGFLEQAGLVWFRLSAFRYGCPVDSSSRVNHGKAINLTHAWPVAHLYI